MRDFILDFFFISFPLIQLDVSIITQNQETNLPLILEPIFFVIHQIMVHTIHDIDLIDQIDRNDPIDPIDRI